MTTIKCPHCDDTGVTDDMGYLDCTAPRCNAATDRASLNEFADSLIGTHDDLLWAVHQRALVLAEQAFAERLAAQTLVVSLPPVDRQ